MLVALNLLPPEKKAALRTGFIYAYAQTMLFIFFIVVAFASGTIVAVRFLLKGTYEDLASRATAGADESQSITADIKKMNEYLKRIETLNQRFNPWSKVLEHITTLVPEGTQLESLRMDRSGKIAFSGVARRRDDVLLLKDRLERSSLFKDVKWPLSNILQQKNVKFDFEMQYVFPPGQEPIPEPAAKK